ncbi:unnamed protein product [Absidia cylindrospora]
MQLSLLKTLFIIGTLAGVAMAQGGYGKKYHHHKGGVIKRTILIDGCTGKPVEKPPPSIDEVGILEPEDPFVEPMVDPTVDDDIFSINEGYPAEDELVDDYDQLGGGDLNFDELII